MNINKIPFETYFLEIEREQYFFTYPLIKLATSGVQSVNFIPLEKFSKPK